MNDEIERTATGVRMTGEGQAWVRVHRLVEIRDVPTGRAYATLCGDVYFGAYGAVLTTRAVSCRDCLVI